MMTKTINCSAILETKSSGIEEGRISGYASVFDVVDQQGDRIVKGAFQNSMHEWRQKGQMPKMLWQHNVSEPIGVWKSIQEDEKGLYVEGRLLLDLQKGKEAYALVKENVVDSFSIGFRIVQSVSGKKKDVRLLTEVDLFEISLVTFAANTSARILNVKDSRTSINAFQKAEYNNQ